MTDVLTLSPGAIAEWVPFWKAAGFFLATFVLEDVATISAGLMLAAGAISWPAAFAACFLGIWIGDAGLYGLARFAGRGWFERSSWKKFSPQVARSEAWFASRSATVLVFSRLVPGMRLPTFLAAGFLRLPAGRFLLITGLAAAVWTFGLLALTQIFGAHLAAWLHAYKAGGWCLLGAGVILIALLQLVHRFFLNYDFRKLAAGAGRWRHWEFWPMWLFYPPVAFYYAWLSLKYRGALLPTAANPGILAGGMVGESKMATLSELMATSAEFMAEAELITGATPAARLASLREICARRNIAYPFILKPDAGQRGAGIKLIRAEAQALAYFQRTAAPLLVQRFAPGPGEAGVFYYRFPGEARGRIFAITEKVFPVVTGDGHATVAELIWRDPRARCVAGKYLDRLGARQNEVLPAGATLKLVEAGNHAQGCIFRDGRHLATPELAERIDAISQKLTGFHIGRYDIRYATEADFCAGKNFSIIELNGASAEASNIYDRRNSLWAAYRTLFRQWDLVFAIGAENRRRGCATTKLSHLWRLWRGYAALAATYPAAD
jgi:membrane protein DedA with SNARE-associated domain